MLRHSANLPPFISCHPALLSHPTLPSSFLSESRLIGRQTSWPSAPLQHPPLPTPGPSINYASLYRPPPLSLHPPLPPCSDCNRILPAAYSLRAFINVSHLRRALRGQEKKKKQNKQNIKLAAEGELWCGRCRCHVKRRRPGGKVCLESVVCPPCWAREPLIQDIPESERTFFTDQETIIWTWIKFDLV